MSDRDAKDLTLGPGDLLSPILLQRILPKANASKWAIPLSAAMVQAAIIGPLRMAHFLANVGHESMDLARTEENLRYTAKRLLEVPGLREHFTALTAAQYELRPQAIANRVYANRHGNRDEASGDGWRYRGGGLIQLTFHDNYADCGQAIGLDLLGHPELVREDPSIAARSAAWYWDSRKINRLADADDTEGVRRAINGGLNGLDDVKARLALAKSVLGV